MTTDGPREVPLEDLFTEPSEPSKRTRKPRGPSTTTTDTIHEILEAAAGALALTPLRDYTLSKDEIDKLADTWARVAKEYPAFGRYLIEGRKASVWGNVVITHLIIFSHKYDVYQEHKKSKPPKVGDTKKDARPTAPAQAGTARAPSGQEWARQDDVSPGLTV